MSRGNVIIVDDDYITVENLEKYLEIRGFSVATVDTIEEALETLRGAAFDVIFVDIMLPPGDIFTIEETRDGRYTGLKFLELIHMRKAVFNISDSTKIFMITNWREEPQVESFSKQFGFKILNKPLEISTIDRILEI